MIAKITPENIDQKVHEWERHLEHILIEAAGVVDGNGVLLCNDLLPIALQMSRELWRLADQCKTGSEYILRPGDKE